MEFKHNPIMINECLELLNIKKDGVYIDGTVGGAGHSAKILSSLGHGGRLVAIDRDAEAIAVAKQRLGKVKSDGTFDVVKDRYSNMPNIIKGLGITGVHGILLDIGVSSYQLDNVERGFGYMTEAKPDMRMGADEPIRNAYDIINKADIEELEKIIREYGEERWWKRIAQFIVKERGKKTIETTQDLVKIIMAAVPAGARKEKQHPAKRTFQGLRIAVNGELDELETVLEGFENVLLPGGRAVIITFHSLEDRIVKNKFREFKDPCTCPAFFPQCVCGKKPLARIVTNRPVTPTSEEIKDNHRARSAKLRAIEWL